MLCRQVARATSMQAPASGPSRAASSETAPKRLPPPLEAPARQQHLAPSQPQHLPSVALGVRSGSSQHPQQHSLSTPVNLHGASPPHLGPLPLHLAPRLQLPLEARAAVLLVGSEPLHPKPAPSAHSLPARPSSVIRCALLVEGPPTLATPQPSQGFATNMRLSMQGQLTASAMLHSDHSPSILLPCLPLHVVHDPTDC